RRRDGSIFDCRIDPPIRSPEARYEILTSGLGRYWYTARHLSSTQALALIARRLRRGRRRRFAVVGADMCERSPARASTARRMRVLERPERGDCGASRGILDHRFRFLNVERHLTDIDWA